MLELAKAVSFLICILSLYWAGFSAFFVPGTQWEERMWMAGFKLLAAAAICFYSGMVFSWPSKAKLLDYGYDRESAMWSRDALEQVFNGVIASPALRRVHIVAHSIGTMLAMEALRQIYDRHGGVVVEKIGAVVFASPDIDMDVFSASVERVGPIASKITLVTATNDRALALSSMLAGGTTRVGAAEQVELKRMGLRVIDASQQGWGLINHDLFLSNAKIRQVIRNAIDGRPTDGA